MVILQTITELSCHAAEIVKLLKTVKLDVPFKKRTEKLLTSQAPLQGWLRHSQTSA